MDPRLILATGYLFLAALLGVLGRNRKLGGWGYFFASLLLTPFVGTLLLLASDPKRRGS